jgi:hypothetical protein
MTDNATPQLVELRASKAAEPVSASVTAHSAIRVSVFIGDDATPEQPPLIVNGVPVRGTVTVHWHGSEWGLHPEYATPRGERPQLDRERWSLRLAQGAGAYLRRADRQFNHDDVSASARDKVVGLVLGAVHAWSHTEAGIAALDAADDQWRLAEVRKRSRELAELVDQAEQLVAEREAIRLGGRVEERHHSYRSGDTNAVHVVTASGQPLPARHDADRYYGFGEGHEQDELIAEQLVGKLVHEYGDGVEDALNALRRDAAANGGGGA